MRAGPAHGRGLEWPTVTAPTNDLVVVDGEPFTTLSRTASGEPVPNAWARALRATSDPLVSWVCSIAVTLLAFFLRIWHLGTPHVFEFDETYYAKDAWSLLHFGYARDYASTANDQILAGHTTNQWQSSPEMVVHPEVGKWMIAAGEKLFGMTPFGWRISAVVIGSLMILVLIRLVTRMTRSTLLGCVAGLVMTFDGLQFVLSRLALLDIFLAFWLLCAVTAMVVDRDWHRARLARRLDHPVTGREWGPRVLWRPWLLVAGLCWGLAIGTKWDAAYPMAAFGVLSVLWSAGARRSFGVRWSVLKSAVADGLPSFVLLVPIALLVYVVSWTGWLMHASVYADNLGQTQYTTFSGHGHCDNNHNYIADQPNTDKWPTKDQPPKHGIAGVEQSVESLWYYHRDVFTFHTNFLNCATHVYQSSPAGWLLLNRPVGVAADTGIKPGVVDGGQTCTAPSGDTCLRQVLLLGTPAVWWAGAVALLFALVMWVGARDWRYGFCVVGALSTWLPWFQFDTRPIFSYYAIATLPFTVVALALAIGHLIGPGREASPRRTVGVSVAGAFMVLVVANFGWFWPIYTNALLTHGQWLQRIWFSRWI